MARYNTATPVNSYNTSGGTLTLNTPLQGAFTELTGTSAVTVNLPNPALFTGTSQVFYNASTQTVTLSTVATSGSIAGPGLTTATSQTLPTSGTSVLYSDGINWVQVVASGGPLAASTLSLSGQLTSTATTGTAPFVVSSTTNVANLNASSLGGATFASPGSIGSGTASSGAFTTLSASSTVSGTGFSTYLASPPAIGGTAPAAGTFTTLTSAANNAYVWTNNNTLQGSTATAGQSILFAGGVGIGGTLYTVGLVETSSIAFKENVNPIIGALDSILKLTGVTYNRKDTKKHEAGLIAEDVYKHAPDLVALDERGKPYGIHYTKVSAYLIECVKTLQAEIDQLKSNKKTKGKK